ncbi:MAG: acyltransferase [Bacteroidales bacterium]|nr:acyltransferase [Bacteroidales bacterium]
MLKNLESRIFLIQNMVQFEELALILFHIHYQYNPVYRTFCDNIGIDPSHVGNSFQIPCLPVSLFKYHKILPSFCKEKLIFETSGTTSQQKGSHFIAKPSLYEQSILRCFEFFYGHPSRYHFLALIPNYLERPNSSLVYMIKTLINISQSSESGFYLDNFSALYKKMKKLENDSKRTTFLIGTTFALIDFLTIYPNNYHAAIIMETGGMKGRREEWPRFYLHEFIKQKSQVNDVHSEYGMTELLSQAYSLRNGLFQTPPWMKIFLRDPHEPRFFGPSLKQGVIHIIDLANMYSCPFIATEDVGRWHSEGLEIIGRMDFSDLRGCSIMTI